MPRIGRFMKKSKLDSVCQQTQIGSAAASSVPQVDGLIPPSGGSGAAPTSSLCPFRPPRTEPPPALQTCTNGAQHSELPDEDLDPEADEALKRKRHKTTEFWDVKTIESDGTIKQLHLSVREAIKPPNSRKIVLMFNDRLQPVGNKVGILSDVVEMLGTDNTKFPICEKDWRKVRSRDKIYNECVKELFHFEEDSGGIIKRTTLKMLGRAWKDTRNHLYHYFYKSDLTLEQNIKGCPSGITVNHWRWFLDYLNMKKQRKELRRLSNMMNHLDCCLKMIHLLKLLERSTQPSSGTQREETQRVLLELQAKLAVEKLKRKAMEDEEAAKKTKREAIESALMCLVRGQGGVLPPDVIAWMNSLEGQSRELN
ncbi:hypothetical protein Ahy_A03g013586 [Arachis hypogaea]|uniref:Uncharacterized protein n=1 Tax=Arachis hypogaea TaxID=3818 RepID=A0A445DVW0_ARAHY|nr:hypothetical protein Ahy_A03g013586 [Arachis hypogaea]